MGEKREKLEALLRLADWHHQRSLLYEGSAVTAALGALARLATAVQPADYAAGTLILILSKLLMDKAEAEKSKAEEHLSKILGDPEVSWTSFFKTPTGIIALTALAVMAIRIVFQLLGLK